MLYGSNWMLHRHERKWSTDSNCNMDEPWKHYAKWKKPDTTDHMLHDYINLKYPDKSNSQMNENRD